jgi:RNA polymerase sporulation-specific sigma factor
MPVLEADPESSADDGVRNPYESTLTDEELVSLSRTGDCWAVDTLVYRYRNLARSKASPYFLAGSDRDDLLQEAMIGLVQAIRRFDLEGPCPFSAFAELCVRRQVLSAVKASMRLKHGPMRGYVSLNAPARVTGGGYIQLRDVIPARSSYDPEQVVLSSDTVTSLEDCFNKHLSSLEAEVLALHLEGSTCQEIAEKLGRRVKAVYNALQRIKEKTQTLLEARSLDEQIA